MVSRWGLAQLVRPLPGKAQIVGSSLGRAPCGCTQAVHVSVGNGALASTLRALAKNNEFFQKMSC